MSTILRAERPLAGVAAILLLAVRTVDAQPLRLPLGLDAAALVIPADNPLTREKVELGKQLFFDPRWSRSKTVSCASCHAPEHGWADPRRFSVRADGKPTPRHAPTVINRAFGAAQQWTGARRSLEDQALKSSDSDPETVVRHLGAIPGYQAQFEKVFGTPVTAESVARAIAAFERTIVSGNAPYDRFIAGDGSAMSPAALRGFAVFTGKARCVVCHSGFNFTDERYHNVGAGMDAAKPDPGRFALTNQDADRGAFKTPTLRDAARRPPYMHDGGLATLAEVVDFYDRGGIANPSRSPLITPLALTAAERADLVAFLEALRSPARSTPPCCAGRCCRPTRERHRLRAMVEVVSALKLGQARAPAWRRPAPASRASKQANTYFRVDRFPVRE